MRTNTLLAAVLGAILLSANVQAALTTNSWAVPADGKWETSTNWSLLLPPSTNGQSVISITNSVTKTVTIDSATTTNSGGDSMTISNLLVSTPSGTTNTLFLNDAGTNTPLRVLNNATISANGALVLSNSILRIDGAAFAIESIITNLAGGQIRATSGTMTLGLLGRGDFTTLGGSFVASNVTLGALAGSQGTLTMRGGTNEILSTFSIGLATSTTGTVWITGGQLTATNNSTRIGNAGVGQMTVSNGNVFARDVHVGIILTSRGTLAIAGGTIALESGLTVGENPNATGTVWMTGGQLEITNGNAFIARSGFGQMTISNGTTFLRDVTAGLLSGSRGTLTIAGGTNTMSLGLTVGNSSNAIGSVWMTGGQLLLTNGGASIFLSGATGSAGQFTMSNGTVMSQSIRVGDAAGSQGTLTVAGGTNTVAAELVIGFAVNATGAVWVTGGQLNVTNSLIEIGHDGIGQMTVSNGTLLAKSVTVSTNGTARGTFSVVGGTVFIAGQAVTNTAILAVASGSGSTGNVDIVGGQLTVTNGTFGVGNDGSLLSTGGVARVTVSNSVLQAASILIGDNTTNSASSLVVSSNGSVVVSGGLRANGIKTTLIEGGTLEVLAGAPSFEDPELHNRISVGFQGDGRMLLSNGTVRTPEMVVGHLNGRGTFEMAGGALNLSSNLLVGLDPTATGTVFITGGALTVTNGILGVGSNGLGRVTVSNGFVDAVSVLVGDTFNGDSDLTVAGNGHVRSRGGLRSNGIKTTLVNGGTLEVVEDTPPFFEDPILHNRIVIALQADGKLVVSNGTVRTPGMVVGASAGQTGTLSIAGGITSVYSNLIVGLVPGSTGIVVATAGSLFVTNAISDATLEVRNGTLTFSGGFMQTDTLVVTNANARLIHTGGTLLYNVLVLDPNQSAVGDGIPNGWKQQYGLDPFNPAVANADADGDGLSNQSEFLSGTDPTNSVSSLRITSIVKTGNDLYVTWMTSAGKTNALQFSSDTSYTTNFTALFTVTNTTGSVTNYLDVGAATNNPARFYRVRLVP